MDKQCSFCGNLFSPSRKDAKFCSAVCKTNAARGKAPKEAEIEDGTYLLS